MERIVNGKDLKMKVLWLCNIMPAQIAEELHRPVQNICGWMNVLAEELIENPGYELVMLFPIDKKKQRIQGQNERISYYSFPQNIVKPEQYIPEQEPFFEHILETVSPDVIHIWGSEYPHTLAMTRACEKKELLSHMVISIQGLISVYAKHYDSDLPYSVIHGKTFRDLIRRDGIREAKKKFEIRGGYEIEALQKANHVIGRTEWDLACVKMINPHIHYHHCDEMLRPAFYTGGWELKNCRKHSIFTSQWEYPIKGLHLLLKAFRQIVKDFPDAALITTGKDPFQAAGKEKLKQTYYYRYLMRLIDHWGLRKNVIFLGKKLNESEMKEQYLRAHVFVLPSAIENSPNSMGEAMLLGTPVIAANTGGVSSMLTHNREGFLYPFDEPYMLAYYIKYLFEHDELTDRLSAAGKIRASQTHHVQNNTERYLLIYKQIS